MQKTIDGNWRGLISKLKKENPFLSSLAVKKLAIKMLKSEKKKIEAELENLENKKKQSEDIFEDIK
jgi:hypothetical protein